ncbi:MAG: transposase [Planctomycetota bacterium]|jgi:transposase InsO family protein
MQMGIPRSTAQGWLASSQSEVVTIDVANKDLIVLQEEVLILRQRIESLLALLRLLVVLLKVTGTTLNYARLGDGSSKALLLRAIERSRTALPLRAILRVLRLSRSRYHSWNRQENCSLGDMPSCPRSSPQRLTCEEVKTIKEMVTSSEYRHVPTATLAVLAQRIGRVIASPSTWFRLVRLYKWRRPRVRLHPAKPTVGIRATTPNEIWHVDTTIIRLLDGTRTYVHAVIDNFSRRILSWRVSSKFEPSITAELLLNAASDDADTKPTLLVDGGVENYNSAVDRLVDSGMLKRLLAQTDISFSNSLVESWWRSLKHQWLFLNSLDSVNKLEKLVAFYVDQHNTHLPHSAFHGQTPDEMYFGTGDQVPKELDSAKSAARQARFEANRAMTCPACVSLS